MDGHRHRKASRLPQACAKYQLEPAAAYSGASPWATWTPGSSALRRKHRCRWHRYAKPEAIALAERRTEQAKKNSQPTYAWWYPLQKYTNRGLQFLDLVQGNIGLMRGWRSLSTNVATSFLYATWWIRQLPVRLQIRDNDRIPVHMIESVNKVLQNQSVSARPRARTDARGHQRWTWESIKFARSLASPRATSHSIHPSVRTKMLRSVTSLRTEVASPADAAIGDNLTHQYVRLWQHSHPREKILRMRFGIGEKAITLEVGHDFNVTRERIRQIKPSTWKLRHPSRPSSCRLLRTVRPSQGQ